VTSPLVVAGQHGVVVVDVIEAHRSDVIRVGRKHYRVVVLVGGNVGW